MIRRARASGGSGAPHAHSVLGVSATSSTRTPPAASAPVRRLALQGACRSPRQAPRRCVPCPPWAAQLLLVDDAEQRGELQLPRHLGVLISGNARLPFGLRCLGVPLVDGKGLLRLRREELLVLFDELGEVSELLAGRRESRRSRRNSRPSRADVRPGLRRASSLSQASWSLRRSWDAQAGKSA